MQKHADQAVVVESEEEQNQAASVTTEETGDLNRADDVTRHNLVDLVWG